MTSPKSASLLAKRLIAVAALLLLALAQTARAETLTVFAAASLKEALDQAARQYATASGDRINVSYAASSALARQIERGAPADVFISADLEWMDYLAARKLVDPATRIALLGNRLVLIAAASSKLSVTLEPGVPLARLLGQERLAMADPDSVPAGKYGKAALEALGAWPSVSGRLVRAENVRAALAQVARGEALLGIVYRTDALAEPGVRIVAEFRAGLHAPIVYPAALTLSSKRAAAARLLAFLRTPATREIWTKHGFNAAE
jgi:molybdate transport system substrate-binding protein